MALFTALASVSSPSSGFCGCKGLFCGKPLLPFLAGLSAHMPALQPLGLFINLINESVDVDRGGAMEYKGRG
jgi:hypothetical protein